MIFFALKGETPIRGKDDLRTLIAMHRDTMGVAIK
jgi:hypothetical protein